jgi:hypothetical protein
VPRLTVSTYNTYRERKGRDPALDALLQRDALICLQEVSPARAREIRRTFGRRAFISIAKHGWQLLALVLPEDAWFISRHTASLNCYGGVIPRVWSLRRGYHLFREDSRAWKDSLEPRVAQVVRIAWRGMRVQVVNTHLPYEAGLRDRCISRLPKEMEIEDALLVGDLNATPKDLFLNDLVLAEGLSYAGPGIATHNSGRRIDYVLYRGALCEAGFTAEKGLSDHLLITAELEV